MPTEGHCSSIVDDRNLGSFWEKEFCRMGMAYGHVVTLHQFKKDGAAVAYSKKPGQRFDTLTLPDVTLWTTPGQHHEIKHKCPTGRGHYGLEKYRFEALLSFAKITQQPVYYTIHNHALNGGKENRENSIHHWFTALVTYLADNVLDTRWGTSWIEGKPQKVPIHFWNSSLWVSLSKLWVP